MARDYLDIFCEEAELIFGEKLLDYMMDESSDSKDSLEMEYELTQKFGYLNYLTDARKLREHPELWKDFLKIYQLGVLFLQVFNGDDGPVPQTMEQFAYILLNYMTYGHCNSNFVPEVYRNIKWLNKELKVF